MFNPNTSLASDKFSKKIARILFFLGTLALGFIISIGLVAFAALLLAKCFAATYSILPMWAFDAFDTTINILVDWPLVLAIPATLWLMGPWLFNKAAWFFHLVPETQDYGWKLFFSDMGSLFLQKPQPASTPQERAPVRSPDDTSVRDSDIIYEPALRLNSPIQKPENSTIQPVTTPPQASRCST